MIMALGLPKVGGKGGSHKGSGRKSSGRTQGRHWQPRHWATIAWLFLSLPTAFAAPKRRGPRSWTPPDVKPADYALQLGLHVNDELVAGPTPGSTFWNLQIVDIPLASDMTLENFIRESLRTPSPNLFARLSELSDKLPAEGSIYIIPLR